MKTLLIVATLFLTPLLIHAQQSDGKPMIPSVTANGEAVMDLLRELHRGGATICMVTHDPRFARCAERSIRLFDGRIVEENAMATANAAS